MGSSSALGVMVGAAVGDALGAPFEFGPAGAFRKRFPEPGANEMVGGGVFGWAPGEFTDDTQMGLALAESLLERDGFDPADVWERFRRWAATANDVGRITRAALERDDWRTGAREAHDDIGMSAGNGGLMRCFPVALFHLGDERAARRAAIAQAALTHHDPAAQWGAAIAVELVRRCVLGADLGGEVAGVVASVPSAFRRRFAECLGARWRPTSAQPGNGTVWTCLAQAVWAVRRAGSFEEAVVTAIELGGDTDTVACVTGALAGAVHGVEAIPSRWTASLHGTVGLVRYEAADLEAIARRLSAR
jgi:ADP-ribosyl-[dinitrogen reductase] hydrolase